MADHDHDHDHGHGQGHAHSHVAARTGRAFAIGVSVNLVFVGVELVAGVVAGSVALMSDAAHNFGDVLGLVLAWAPCVSRNEGRRAVARMASAERPSSPRWRTPSSSS